MLEKLASLEQRYNELTEEVMTPALIADQKAWQKAMKARAELEEIVGVYSKYRKCLEDIEFAEEAAADKSDEGMAELALSEMETCAEQKEFLEAELRRLLIPKDKNDSKNVVLEVRAGTGGDEAALFAADLFRMYARYGERKGWRTEIIDANYTDAGGLKEIIVMLEGRDVYSRMKFESGVHRVQRVPATEASGRIHTSAATVAVLPEAEEVDVEINPNDIKTDVFCASGPGGQCVNTTQSAVRLTHIPTGIVVSCQDEKSQHKNKDKAMKVLRARVLEKTEEEQRQSSEAVRRQQVGSGDRSERIRTYNFPQGRVTDHRVGLTLHKLEWILQGDLDEIIDALSAFDQARRLSEGA